MANVKFTVNGRDVPAGQVGRAMSDALEQAAFEQVRKNVQERLRRLRCPEHHQAPRVTSSGSSLATLEWSISGCCDRVVDAARRALN